MEIDLVYLWVDNNDPIWQKKLDIFTNDIEEGTSINCKGRYSNNDELKYSLRSIEKYAPWIRKIFIITDNQTPEWLDPTNPQIKIIDHKDILPPESLPCFNSSVIEFYFHKIPELSNQFIYANDDMFINRPVSPSTFFAGDGLPIIRLNRKPFRQVRWFWRERIIQKPLNYYSKTILNATKLTKERYGIYYTGLPHHNIDAYLKSDCQKVVEKIFNNEIKTVLNNHIRSQNDIQRVIYSYVALAEKRGHLQYVSERESAHIQIHKERHFKKLNKYSPILFCMNDSQFVQDNDRTRMKSFLKNYFPEKSKFERF